MIGTPRPNMIKSISVVSATMGVDQLLWIRSERVDKSYFQSKMLSDVELRKNLIHGAEQGVIRQIPQVACFPNLALDAFLQEEFPKWQAKFEAEHPECRVVKLIAEPKVEDNLIGAICADGGAGGAVPFVVLAIGPEGGWIPPEVELLKAHGFLPFHCGERILRTETAVVALLAQVALAKDALANGQISVSVKRARSEGNSNAVE